LATVGADLELCPRSLGLSVLSRGLDVKNSEPLIGRAAPREFSRTAGDIGTADERVNETEHGGMKTLQSAQRVTAVDEDVEIA
jgi:hypothetical protein